MFAYGRCDADEQPSVVHSDLRGDRGDDGAKLTAQPIATRRRSDRAADREGDAQRHRRGIVEKGAPQGLGSGRATGACQCLERPASADPPDQAESRVRPLSRRALMIDRPARVRIRARKPCLRARRRVLGWNVRFTVSRPSRTCSTNGQAPRPRTSDGRSGEQPGAEPERIKARASWNRSTTARRDLTLLLVTAPAAWKLNGWQAATIAASAQTT